MATAQEVQKIFLLLMTNYPYWEREQSEQRIGAAVSLYTRLLQDIPADVLEAAALTHISQSKFFPTVAELRDHTISVILPQRKSALEAWHDHTDPLGQRVKKLLPYYDRTATIRDMTMIQALFCKTYDQIVEREQREAKLLPDVKIARQRFLNPPQEQELKTEAHTTMPPLREREKNLAPQLQPALDIEARRAFLRQQAAILTRHEHEVGQ